MKRISVVILLLMAVINTAQAQKNYKPAYIVKTAGDTLRGFINYKEWENSPQFIEFKSSVADTKPERYTPVTLQSFEIIGMDKYISYIGNVSIAKNRFPDLPSLLDTTTVRDSAFLHIVYESKPISLLAYNDAVKERFFITEGSGTPVELQYYQFYTSGSSIQQLKIFQGYLSTLAQKYNPSNSSIGTLIMKSDFKESDLFNIIRSINNDRQTKSSGSGGTRFYAGILFARTTTDFVGQTILDGQKAYSYIPAINFGMDIFTNKYTQRFFLRANLGLTANMPHFKYQSSSYLYDYKFKQYTISLSPQLIYNFYNKENLKVYLGLGAGINYSAYGANEYTVNYFTFSTVSKDQYSFNHIWFNSIFKGGAFINKKIEIYAQYSPPTSITNYVFYAIRNSPYGIGVHYLINK